MSASQQGNTEKKLSGIFISYRRTDNPDAVGRIYDRLVSEFGKARVFKDVDSIPLGQDFRGHLNDIVGNCAVVLAIIGPRWVDSRNDSGKRRLEDPDDFVRIELEAALSRNVPVVPVLVAHAPNPGTNQLPSSLASLAFRQSIEVRPDPDFHNDATRLAYALHRILDPTSEGADPVADSVVAPVAVPAAAIRPDRRLGWMSAVAALALVAVAFLAIPRLKPQRAAPAPQVRTEIVTPATDRPSDFALSPDGTQIAFVAKDEGASRLWLRSFATSVARPLPETEGATGPFWSPDGKSLGFFTADSLKRLDLDGGQMQTLATVRDGFGEGAWGKDGTILYPPGTTDHLRRVSASGGASTEVDIPGHGFVGHRVPHFLPDGRHFLFVSIGGSAVGKSPVGTFLGSLDGSNPVQLTTDTDRVTYLPSGWMLWIRAGALVAQRLDLAKAELTGPVVTVASDANSVSASATGLMAYRARQGKRRQLAWVNRSGVVLGTVDSPGENPEAARVSPDGRRTVLTRVNQNNRDVWLLEGARASRMTFDTANEWFPVWSPDGKTVAYTSDRHGFSDLFLKPASGAGGEELLLRSEQNKTVSSWSPDGRYLLYFGTSKDNSRMDIWVLPMSGDRKPFLFLKTPFSEVWAQFSPDGRWVAYQSEESGRNEVYVRPFVPPAGASGELEPAATEGQWQVSTAGGIQPVWRPDGKELYYLNPAGEMMAAQIEVTATSFEPGEPVRLFQTNVVGGGMAAGVGRQFDIASDGRFLINMEIDTGEPPPITLIQNWNPDAGK